VGGKVDISWGVFNELISVQKNGNMKITAKKMAAKYKNVNLGFSCERLVNLRLWAAIRVASVKVLL
jgi:hypothetical protein